MSLCLAACSMNLSRSRPSSVGDDGGGLGDDSVLKARLENLSYFRGTVLPLFEAQCARCHNPPRDEGEGPTFIFEYNPTREFLLRGPSDEANDLMRWMRAEFAHPGGDVCQGDGNKSPCFEVKLWWAKEIAAGKGTTDSTPLGELTFLSNRGSVSGWVVDLDSEITPVDVEITIDGPKGTGVSLGTVPANLANPPTGFRGNHGFSFPIPAQYRNGVRHALYAYGIDKKTGLPKELARSNYSFQLYSPKAENFYESTVKPALVIGCNTTGCHTNSSFFNYESAFYDYLLSPSPAAGGGATASRLYRKGSAAESHGGGNHCNDGSPCTELAAWFAQEMRLQ